MAEPLPDDIRECEDFQAWLYCHELDSPGLFTFRNAFTKVLKYYFSNPKNLITWRDDLACEVDKFTVKPGAIIDPGNTNNVPGIIITTGDGINYETPWIHAQINRQPDFATDKNVHLAKVNMTMVCLHFDADIVAKISDEVMACLTAYEVLFQETWNWLQLWRPVQQTSPQLARKAQDPEAFENFFESRVVVELTYEYGNVLRRESRRMQDYMLLPVGDGIGRVDAVK